MSCQVLRDRRFLRAQQWSELEIDSAPKLRLLRTMQFNLCMTQPIVEGHDDTVREGAYATTTKTFAVLNQKNTIRNRRVFSVGTVHDVWIYSHDAPWKQIRKGKRVFTADPGRA